MNGQRGVWSEALLPGKYAFNTYAGKVVSVLVKNGEPVEFGQPLFIIE